MIMVYHERYDGLVRQAIGEVAVGEMPTTPELLARVHQDFAQPLGDILYRLCIEYGIEWNEFRESTIDALVRRPMKVGANGHHPLAGIEVYHDLVLLALETMPADIDEPGS